MDLNYEDPDPPMVNTNDCGCPIPASPRRAAGCVRVQDTQFAGQAGEFPGVRRVRVIGVNKLYDIRRTYTDDMGCFQLPGSANFSGKAWFMVRFKSPRGEISRLSLLRPWDLFWAMTFIAPPTTIPFNDIQITFDEEDEEFRNGRGQWAAATVNNALHEYHDFAISNNIAAPPNRLKILLGEPISQLGPLDASGAPMFRQAGSNLGPISIILDFLNIEFNNPLPAPIANLIPSDAPDLFINVWDTWPSDSLKAIAYHELGHAGHYAQVGEAQWLLYRRHIIANVGYSNIILGEANFHPTLSAPGVVALGEAWGEFTESYLTDLAYGLNHSNTLSSAMPSERERWRYLFLNEHCLNATPLFAPCNQFIDGFIPYGLMLDLMDDNTIDYLPFFANGIEETNVVDIVSGYTIEELFSQLRSDTYGIDQYKSRLLPILPPANSSQHLNDLFESYEW